MNEMFAVCPNLACGITFPAQGIINGPGIVKHLEVSNSMISCPRCGTLSPISDGVYTYRNQNVTFQDGPQRSKDIVQQARALINALQEGSLPKEQSIAALKALSPALAKISQQTAEKTNYKEWAGLIIALLSLLISIQQGYFKRDDDSGIKREYIDHLLRENEEQKARLASFKSANTPVKAELHPGRNEACPCGSGRKFKKCHGFQSAK